MLCFSVILISTGWKGKKKFHYFANVLVNVHENIIRMLNVLIVLGFGGFFCLFVFSQVTCVITSIIKVPFLLLFQ